MLGRAIPPPREQHHRGGALGGATSRHRGATPSAGSNTADGVIAAACTDGRHVRRNTASPDPPSNTASRGPTSPPAMLGRVITAMRHHRAGSNTAGRRRPPMRSRRSDISSPRSNTADREQHRPPGECGAQRQRRPRSDSADREQPTGRAQHRRPRSLRATPLLADQRPGERPSLGAGDVGPGDHGRATPARREQHRRPSASAFAAEQYLPWRSVLLPVGGVAPRPVVLFRRGAAPTTRSGRATTRASTSARSSGTTPATARARRRDTCRSVPVGSVLSTMFGP